MSTSYTVEIVGGDTSPPLVSEQAAHDWAASARPDHPYLVHVTHDGEEVGSARRYEARPS